MNKHFIYFLTVLCFSVFSIGRLAAQTETDFWFVAPDADVTHGTDGDRPTFFMITTGNLPADVSIDMPKNAAFTKIKKHIPANSYWKYSFEGNDIALVENVITDASKVTNKGVHITSNAPVSVYYQVDGPVSKEIFTLKGEKALGKKFYTPFQTAYKSYEGRNGWAQIHIVATQDNTTIILKPTANIVAMVAPNVGTGLAGSTNTIKLNKGETFVAKKVIRDNEDPTKLSGSYIESDKDIAVTIADDVVDMSMRQDICGDQLVPIDGLGTSYVVVKGYTSNVIPAPAFDYIYIVATEDGTTIKVQGDVAADINTTINAGQTYQIKMGYDGEAGTNNACYITTSKPAYCLHQSGVGGEIGASILPSMYSVASRQITLYNGQAELFNNLVFIFHDNALNSFSINGKPLTLTDVKSIPGLTGWKYAKSSVLNSSLELKGATRISNNKGAFALGYFYGNTGGTALYGFLSNFGAFSFDADTVYKCTGDSYLLDGGYAKNYEWKNDVGTVVGTAQTLTVTNPGKYTLTLDQDGTFAYDTIWVLNRNFSTAQIVYTGINPQKIYINESGTSSAKSYVWKLNNGAITYTTDTITVDWTSMPNKNIEVKITDIASGCDTTLTGTYAPVKLPDNISDANCVTTPPAQEWKIREAFGHNTVILNNLAQTYVGDLNNDGHPEIVSLTREVNGSSIVGDLIVFKGPYHKVINTIPAKGNGYHNWGGGGVALLKAKINGKDTAFIVAHDMNGYLYAFDMNGVSIPTWTSGRSDIQVAPAATVAPWQFRDIGIADFNNDGIPEIYCGKYIFNAVTGKKICESPSNFGYANSFGDWNGSSTVISHYKTAPIAADIDGDGQLEYIAGNKIYKVDITAGTMTLLNTVTPPTDLKGSALPNDGKTSVADIDLDGHLDVIVSGTVAATHRSFIWIWSPTKNKVLARTSTDFARNQSMPLIGDIDGDKKLEIVCITSNQATNATNPLYDSIRAYKYDGTDKLFEFWRMPHSDRSGNTGMTLFDFNQDRIVEIVYRDESHLRIINGSGKDHITGLPRAPYNLSTFQCSSATGNEYPVIADIDGDGSAEIIVNGHPTNTTFPFAHGPLRIFKADAGTSWASARKVWNQYGYNAVNINEDLTVPRFQLNPATVFPGIDGVLRTVDDVRPYNGFLQQQTILNKNGNPLWLAANAQAKGQASFNYDASRDSLTITIKVHNAGEAALQDPIKVTAYKDNIGNAIKETYAHAHKLMPGDSTEITFGISKFKEKWNPFTGIIIQINDNGNGYNDQPVCDSTNRDFKTGSVIAADDRVMLAKNSSNNRIMVTLNDIKSCSNPKVTIVTPPKHAASSTVINDSVIQYSPATDYIGNDTLRYKVTCGADSYEAMVYITVIEMPDNISDAECYIDPIKFDWKIRNSYTSPTVKHHNYVIPLVGDINGDKIPEIVTLNSNLNQLNILWGADQSESMIKINPVNIATNEGRSISPYAMYKTKIGGVDKVIIAVISNPGTSLHAYDLNGGANQSASPLWAVTPANTPNFKGNMKDHISVADFDGDGIPEVYLSNHIFNGNTGALLVKGNAADNTNNTGYSNLSHFSIAANVIGDAKLELIAGTEVYDVSISNKAGTLGNKLTRVAKMKDDIKVGITTINDGNTIVADINQDGKLDVLFVSSSNPAAYNGSRKLVAWDVATESMLCVSDDVNTDKGTGVPFAGNIDTDPGLEVVFMVRHKLLGYKPNFATKKFDLKYQTTVDDESGSTGMTLFDFNNDKVGEIVYRDESSLRIMRANSLTGTFEDIDSYTAMSPTSLEYPVVADVDNDGAAEIVVLGHKTVKNPEAHLSIYRSGSSDSWAPARKVWNQYAYNAVNINEDLTLPRFQLNPATYFPGDDGQLGTADDIQPFNGFLQQQTILNKNGIPLWLAPEAQIDPVYTTNYDIAGDSLVINVKVSNTGSAALADPIYITVYKNVVSTAPGTVKYTYEYPYSIGVGESAIIPVTIPNFKLWLGATDNNTTLIVKVNDKGLAANAQPVCRDANVKLPIKFSSILMANNDYASLPHPGAVIEFDVLANDSLKTCERGTLTAFDTIANSGLHLGTIIINANSTFKYTSTVGKFGVDRVGYYIKCAADSSAARVYILVNKPNALNYIACLPQINPNFPTQVRPTIVNLGFTSIPDVTYTWYPTKTSTTPVTGGINKDTLSIEVNTTADFGSWWVEPVWKGIKFERIEVTLSESTSCGEGLSDCAKDGTVLFREDFGGNNPADPIVRLTGIPEVSTPPYEYNSLHGSLLTEWPGKGQYTITKEGRGGGGGQNNWWRVADHKYPGETRNGYMLQVNANRASGQYYERQLTGLCAGSKLFFSAWIINVQKNVHAADKVNARFLIEHNNIVIAEYTTGAILESKVNDTTDVKWRMYGFDFIVPDGIDNLKLRVINDGTGSAGNDFAMDDIEIRFCAPKIKITPGKDSLVCKDTQLDLNSSYTDKGEFGQDLKGRWERLDESNGLWKLYGTEFSSNNGVINLPITIASFQPSDAGYYRVVIGSSTSIDKINCRAVSDSVSFGINNAKEIYPDIRVQSCPNIGNINLSKYVDVVGLKSIKWALIAAPAIGFNTNGVVSSNSFVFPDTYLYRYEVENSCHIAEGKLYVKMLKDKSFYLPPDTVLVCFETAEALQLNQILGIEAGGEFKAVDAAVNTDYVDKIVAPSIFAGATIFNGKKAYAELLPSYNYTGSLTNDPLAKKVKFEYTPDAGNCLAGKVYTFIIILTNELVP